MSDPRDDETEGDFWNAVGPVMKARSQEKRVSNRQSSAEMLASRGVKFTTHNAGAHLIVDAGSHKVNFWPGTGKWITQGWRFGLVSRGVRSLIKHLEEVNAITKGSA
ncbi:MAG: hypothetical protein H7255_08880 [Ramlibacter sp.]|nr:hypothetical protein [Ramlibacter sp.]